MPYLILIAGLFLITSSAFGRDGSVQGRVWIEDSSIHPLGAKVSAKDKSAEVAQDGTYTLSKMKPGKYDITVEWPEVGIQVKTDVEVVSDEPVLLNFVFKPPRPRVDNIYLPVISKPRTVTITGEYFLHAAAATLEVKIGGKTVPATRVSNTRIELKEDVIGGLLRSMSRRDSIVELPLVVLINNIASNEAKLAFHNGMPGNIQGRVIVNNPAVRPEGVEIQIPARGTKLTLSANGTFAFPKVLPRQYAILLDWPGLGIHEEQTIEVFPGETVNTEFKVNVPDPQITSTTPEVVDKLQPIVLRGRYFLHTIKAAFDVKLGTRSVKAERVSNRVIQISETEIASELKKLKPGESQDLDVSVQVAGVKSAPKKVTFRAASAPPLLAAESAEKAEPAEGDEKEERAPAGSPSPSPAATVSPTPTPVVSPSASPSPVPSP